MPRPTPPPHPIEAYLSSQHAGTVRPATSKKYAAILRRMESSGLDPQDWLAVQVQALDGTRQRASRTTIGVLRSAVLYYLRWRHFEETGSVMPLLEAEELALTLPRASEGTMGQNREAMSRRRYAAYNEAVEGLQVAEQIRTVLLLLPITGLRISEACGLRARNVIQHGPEWTLDIIGKKGKRRAVPLGDEGRDLLETWLAGKADSDFLFPNPCLGLPNSTRLDLSPAQVREVVREFLQPRPELSDVVPHVLRHQFASANVREGVNLVVVRDILGHSSLKTTERYTHPDDEMKRAAIESVERSLARQRRVG